MGRQLARARFSLAVLPLLVVLLASCGGTGAAPPTRDAPPATAVSVGISEPRELVPQQALDLAGIQVISALFTPLVTYDPTTMEPRLAMAESIDSTDQRVWRIRIRDGWTFHDGTAVTPDSFIDAWNFGARPSSRTSSYFSSIDGYEALAAGEERLRGLRVVDPATFEVTLSHPFSQFPLLLGFTGFAPLPRAAFADPAGFREAPVGNGPYRMEGAWQHNRSVTLRRFDAYRGEAGTVERLDFRIYADQVAAFRDVQAGNLDVATVPEDLALEARQSFGERLVSAPTSDFVYLGLPLYDPRYANPDLRRALSLALDRQLIIDTVRNGVGTPATSLVPPVVPGSRSGVCEVCRHDPTQARELFARAGGLDELVLWAGKEGGSGSALEAIANQLRQTLGIPRVEVKTLLNAEYFQLRDERKMTGPFLSDWIMDYPSLQNYLEPLYATGASANRFAYANPRVDDLLRRGDAARSPEEALDLYRQAEQTVAVDLPVLPLWFDESLYVHSERVEKLVVDPRLVLRSVSLGTDGPEARAGAQDSG
ncbi:MAG: ABC transporter substrate-binding protein [Actinomycetota bacterium]|nr:ABC transporter substrate-binding protein [Actinomycetota bacterium]